jgi:hypothetical protein
MGTWVKYDKKVKNHCIEIQKQSLSQYKALTDKEEWVIHVTPEESEDIVFDQVI